jgi:hypothetical protein
MRLTTRLIIILIIVIWAGICVLWRFYAPCQLYRGHGWLETPDRCLDVNGVVQ